jgi:hypothetical protein
MGAVLLSLLGPDAPAQSLVRFDASGNLAQIGASGSGLPPAVWGPSSRPVPAGERCALSVAWTGLDVRFRWYFNGAPLTGETRDTLVLDSVTAQRVGNYFAVAENNFGSVTSRVARVEVDADRDGLGDAWEIASFGSLTNQSGAMDADGDGTSNLREFEDGTSPTNKTSLLARLETAAFGGRIARSPDAPAYQSGELITLTAIPDPGVSLMGWSGALTGLTNPASLTVAGNQAVQATFGVPLDLALNTTTPVTTGGSGGWYGQREISRDGIAAAVAPPLVASEDPYLTTTVVTRKEGTATFDWRIDGERENRLELRVNGRPDFSSTRSLRGVTDWQSKTVYLPAGTNTLRWIYVRNGGGWTESANRPKPRDSAYVDRLVINEYTNPLLDTDGNGLSDLAEYRYFDAIGNLPEADPDRDGVPTRMELADGTDPSDAYSVKPRVEYIVEGQGAAAASPAASVYSYGQSLTNTATPAAGWSFLAWVGPFGFNYLLPKIETNNPSVDRLTSAKTYRAVFALPLGIAGDAPELNWTTSANLPWHGQTLVTRDGVDAVQSALSVETSQLNESWMQTVVTGPGTLSFFWKTSCAQRDYLAFLANAEELAPRLSGVTDWEPVIVALPPGQQTLRWTFNRNYGYDTNVLNIAWVDQVRFTPETTRPEFIELPAGLAGFEGVDLSFRVAARGTPPVTYQVFHNGGALSQPSTNQLIRIPAVTPAMAGSWIIRARNQAGITESAPIPVSILALPPNDNFTSATALFGLNSKVTGYSIGATPETDEPTHDSYYARASVWYRWTAPASGAVRFQAVATNPPSNLILAVHRGSSLARLTEVAAGNAYPRETNGVEVASVEVQFPATAGVSYYVAVDEGTGGGYFDLSWSSISPAPNDAFAARLPLSGTFLSISADNTLATLEPEEPVLFGVPPFFAFYASNSLWWTWTAPVSGTLQITPQSSEGDVLVSVFTGNSIGSLNRLTDPFGATRSIEVAKGTTYAISAGTYAGDPGRFSFLLSMDLLTLAIVPPQPEDDGFIDVNGAPRKPVTIQFSPNLKDWYFWASNNIGSDGRLRLTLKPPTYQDEDEVSSIPPARKRFFRAMASP